MKKVIQTEEILMTIAGIYLISQLGLSLSWWMYIILFFAPDIGMLGYIVNNKLGAVCYNILHHRGIAISIACIGLLNMNQTIILIGLILFAHASFDRILGYGLKHFKGFKYTHLGVLK